MPGFEPTTRARNLARLDAGIFDLLVIGGGITGAGIARAAALRGLAVALVEARDFASGTSSRSSKLIHGGLRYLQQGEIGLVREAATERQALRRIAPHLTVKVPMLVPVYGRTSAGLYKLRVGMMLFDKLAAVGPDERHRILSRDEALALEPRLVPERLQGAGVYPEFVTDDARLVLDTLKAAHHAGAVVVNYTRVTALRASAAERVVELHDEEDGAALATRARVVVNAAGPWVDAIRVMDRPAEPPVLQLTKGIHLVFPAETLPVSHCVVMRASDGRPVFAVPRGRWVYVGTTDTNYEGPLEEPAIGLEDARYLLEAIGRTFRGDLPGPRDVVGAWAGLRPLVREEGRRPSEISRKDEIAVSASGLITIAGGKLTTYRRMAERVLEAAAPVLGRAPGPARDDLQPLAGGDLSGAPDLASYLRSAPVRAAAEGVPSATLTRLIETYGCDGLEVLRDAEGPAALAPLVPQGSLCGAEVLYAVRREMACTLADVLERRSRIAIFDTDEARALAPPAARILAAARGWSATRRDEEITRFDRQAAARLEWRAQPTEGD